MAKHPKRPRDVNQLAKFIVDVATNESMPTVDTPKQARAKKAGAAGGPARARALSTEQRMEIAKVAAAARWKKS